MYSGGPVWAAVFIHSLFVATASATLIMAVITQLSRTSQRAGVSGRFYWDSYQK